MSLAPVFCDFDQYLSSPPDSRGEWLAGSSRGGLDTRAQMDNI